jgi:hypothetical protein
MARSLDLRPVVTDWRKSCKPITYCAHRRRFARNFPRRSRYLMAPQSAKKDQAFLAFRFGFNIVPLQFFAPQRHSQIFFRRAVCGSSRVMP